MNLNFTLMKLYLFIIILGDKVHLDAYLQQDLQQADTQFSQIKPIHKTPNKLIRLSTNLRLFEAGVGKTVVIPSGISLWSNE